MHRKVMVLDHGMGNLRSVAKALEAAGASVTVTADPSDLSEADALCVPGQGIFGRCLTNLARGGWDGAIRGWIEAERPYLGICLGLQVLFESSEESGALSSGPPEESGALSSGPPEESGALSSGPPEKGRTQGLGILGGSVERLPAEVRVPHIGWNLAGERYFYFDHSFAVQPADHSLVKEWTQHGRWFASWIEAGSVTGVQFHPEKSSAAGIDLLKGWLAADGAR